MHLTFYVACAIAFDSYIGPVAKPHSPHGKTTYQLFRTALANDCYLQNKSSRGATGCRRIAPTPHPPSGLLASTYTALLDAGAVLLLAAAARRCSARVRGALLDDDDDDAAAAAASAPTAAAAAAAAAAAPVAARRCSARVRGARGSATPLATAAPCAVAAADAAGLAADFARAPCTATSLNSDQ